MRFDFVNTIYAKNGDRLGYSGCFGASAESPEDAFAHALNAAKTTRKIMGFPVEIEIKVVLRTEF